MNILYPKVIVTSHCRTKTLFEPLFNNIPQGQNGTLGTIYHTWSDTELVIQYQSWVQLETV